MGGQYPIKQHGQSGHWFAGYSLTPLPWQMIFAWYIPCGRITPTTIMHSIRSTAVVYSWVIPHWAPGWFTGSVRSVANLPAYVVLSDPLGLPKNGTRNWTAGFLPPVYQGTQFRPQGSPILNFSRQYEQSQGATEEAETLLNQLDMIHKENRPFQPELDARIQSYELASRMQLAASEALDLDRESLKTHDVRDWAISHRFLRPAVFTCPRLVERGVRYVQIFLEEQPWDSHVDQRRIIGASVNGRILLAQVC